MAVNPEPLISQALTPSRSGLVKCCKPTVTLTTSPTEALKSGSNSRSFQAAEPVMTSVPTFKLAASLSLIEYPLFPAP